MCEHSGRQASHSSSRGHRARPYAWVMTRIRRVSMARRQAKSGTRASPEIVGFLVGPAALKLPTWTHCYNGVASNHAFGFPSLKLAERTVREKTTIIEVLDRPHGMPP